jgi:hypothetical protein
MRIYHNTVLLPETPWRNYYAGGLGGHMANTKRSCLNNIFYLADGTPGFHFDLGGVLLADGNLHWSSWVVEKTPGEFLSSSRLPRRGQPDWFEQSKKLYPPGWTAHDLFANPRFIHVGPGEKDRLDVGLQRNSPAIDAGVSIPSDWADPLRQHDAGKPDIGAVPAGRTLWNVGVDDRFTACGVPRS